MQNVHVLHVCFTHVDSPQQACLESPQPPARHMAFGTHPPLTIHKHTEYMHPYNRHSDSICILHVLHLYTAGAVDV